MHTRVQRNIGSVLGAFGLFAPLVLSAEGVYVSEHFTDFRTLVQYVVGQIIGPLVSILFAATIVYFLWGAVQYIRNSAESDGRTEGRERMIWGIVALAVIAAFWAFVGIVVRTLS
ncbi:MAG: hypothetical protein A2408_01220 [Candidatus Yonathbacteria bacterium RIFOXYC1_FULL_52_10]|uniref:Uncharacterized protein n=1 Tax=Candidatus Yonathbacteria bacterium RIFOXYD1_FULL_52_36 TaxID=1802730 RepID=A0A1G2SKI5_9BACT|nr:MAG: hypothetical protein A2408_01220 [Candidatus Yonathbacteria bacterium RIFOXYC1_FULL_52_10]OHA85585.1 MAG: hypothetical protein A2591_00275 [Candidatus Yonathbacteria bacterium RIFOXYD1_FULL_52_36]